ncbi:MAG: alanine/glycine:cation symporter family protein [Lachnospiraceae bacterium]|nr:alanine/glycine:cation symporter family protein [Lachnospiraceae bacterium]
MISQILNTIDDILYVPILMIVMAAAGIYFTVKTRFVQIRLFKEACTLVLEPPKGEKGKSVSSFQALMVSTASRVGTGNIVGVSTAICLGGAGAVFWMWVMCIIGAASAYMESTLAQIFKRVNKDGSYYGGPAYYIEEAMHSTVPAAIFCVFLIATYAVGFNLLCSYNLQSTFEAYEWYHPRITPLIIGGILALLTGYCLFGGGKRIIRLTEIIVPFMGIFYVAISIIVLLINFLNIPAMFAEIFVDAFNFKAIFGGITGSCMVLGIKRGLFSNEAGVGSAPNASASADVSHPSKQGLVQTISVYIDTMLLCTATALMCLSTRVPHTADVAGAAYVQIAISSVFGKVGPIFITNAMILFAFTTLLGNLYYCDNALAYLNGKKLPSQKFMKGFYVCCVLVVFVGAQMAMGDVWAIADITMGGMTIINLPACMILGHYAIDALKDYEKKKRAGKDPGFAASDIGIDERLAAAWVAAPTAKRKKRRKAAK